MDLDRPFRGLHDLRDVADRKPLVIAQEKGGASRACRDAARRTLRAPRPGRPRAGVTDPSSPSFARRDRVQQRVIDYNTELAAACAGYGPNCRFDGNVVFNFPFTLSQVSGWDYFHPNASGQALLAEITYQAGFGW